MRLHRNDFVLLLSVGVLTVLLSWLYLGEAAQTPSAMGNSFVVREVRVFDGERLLPPTDVVVRDGRIAALGESVADDLPSVDGRGRTLLPGLIDAHVHAYGDARGEALRFGVTAELDMFSDWRQLAAAKDEREGLARTDRADLWSAGTLLTAARGHGTQFGLPIPTLDDAVEADAFVAARIAEGSDYIKLVYDDGRGYGLNRVLPTLSRDSLRAAIAAAKARQWLALVHVGDVESALHAFEAGADGLVHVFGDRIADEPAVAAIRASGGFVVPTLSVMASLAGEGFGAALAGDARLSPWLDDGQRVALTGEMPSLWRNPARLANALENVRRLHAAGVPILAGTDAGNPGTAHGASLHGELALLVEAGLSPSQALAAATSLPARHFGLHDRGRIAPRQRADLVLVEGDPTIDIHATRAIVAVWKNGYRVERDPRRSGAAGQPIDARLLSHFDGDGLDAAFGAGWMPTSDRMAGGSSHAELRRVAGGAAGSAGALEIRGEVVAAGANVWAGAMYLLGERAMQPVDLGDRRELVFQARGGDREYAVLLFSGDDPRAPPARQRFVAGPEWQEVRLALADFAGADPSRLRAFAVTAGEPAGGFALRIDRVEIR